jgi:hypothetical protein
VSGEETDVPHSSQSTGAAHALPRKWKLPPDVERIQFGRLAQVGDYERRVDPERGRRLAARPDENRAVAVSLDEQDERDWPSVEAFLPSVRRLRFTRKPIGARDDDLEAVAERPVAGGGDAVAEVRFGRQRRRAAERLGKAIAEIRQCSPFTPSSDATCSACVPQ